MSLSDASYEELARRRALALEHYQECGSFPVAECERHGKRKPKYVESERGEGQPL